MCGSRTLREWFARLHNSEQRILYDLPVVQMVEKERRETRLREVGLRGRSPLPCV